ncbi:MAG: aminotransferase class I/II-fold pyridoxal phosphate-dependent enzyme, partial [Pseudomonadota bacterium]
DLHAAEKFDAVVVVNPNNPTGRVWPAAPLMMLASVLAARGGHLIVDESFADAAPQRQLSGHCGRPGLIVLRSFGKFFGLAGLRLGFALGPKEEIDRLTAWLGPWAVSGPAISIATKAFADTAWVETTRTRLQADSDALAAALTAHGFEIVGQTPLFVTGARTDAATLHTRLAKEGIWTRAFHYAPTWLRFGVSNASDRARLVAALAAATPDADAAPDPSTAVAQSRES